MKQSLLVLNLLTGALLYPVFYVTVKVWPGAGRLFCGRLADSIINIRQNGCSWKDLYFLSGLNLACIGVLGILCGTAYLIIR